MTLLGLIGISLLALMALAVLVAFAVLVIQDRHTGNHR